MPPQSKKMSKMILEILDYYQSNTLLEIVQDIHLNINRTNKHNKTSNVFHVNGLGLYNDLNEDSIKGMSKAEMLEFLEKFSKIDLLNFSKKIGIKFNLKDSKSIINEQIANHFSFLNLDKNMAERQSH